MTNGLIPDAYIQTGVPLKRRGTIDDMGGLVLFLASKVRRGGSTFQIKLMVSQAGAYVNGGVHLIDGGRLTLYPSSF